MEVILVFFIRYCRILPESCNFVYSSEGVQIGGIASATGVVGIWTGAYHEYGRSSSNIQWKYNLDYAYLLGDPAGKMQVALGDESHLLTMLVGPFWLWKVPDDDPIDV